MPFWSVLLLFVVGAIVAGQLNRGIYRLPYLNKQSISPWSVPPTDSVCRRWYDRIPILGWIFLRRESGIHGAWFWVRPLLIEFFVATGFPAHVWWVFQDGLLPSGYGPLLPVTAMAISGSHLALFALMVVASFIDIDEKTIPVEITDYGVLLGLSLAAIFPHSLLPEPVLTAPPQIQPLWFTLGSLPAWTTGWWGLVAGLSCFVSWFYAISPKIWWSREGILRALWLHVVSLLRKALRINLLMTLFFVLGCSLIVFTWKVGGENWQGLLTSLIGVAFGGGLIWAVRIVGSLALRQEAMGFGDVTLMAMIGAFVGWQPAAIIFFMAPFAGLFLSVTRWVLSGDRYIPYGPFLCFATLLLIEFWSELWFGYLQDIFYALGLVVALIVACCLLIMYGMLMSWRLLREGMTSRSRRQ